MDVNNTRFHLLLGRRDWMQHVPEGLSPPTQTPVWDNARQALSLPPLALQLPVPAPGERFQQSERRGAARDRFGNWYTVADTTTAITFLPSGARSAEPFWPRPDVESAPPPGKASGGFTPDPPPSDPSPAPLKGLAVTHHHYLLVGARGPAPGLLIFDLHAGGPPQHLQWPLSFRPVDLAPRPGGGVWILDAPTGQEPRVWALDRHFRVRGLPGPLQTLRPGSIDDFKPEGEAPRERPARRFPRPLLLGASNAVAIESLPDDTFLVLDVDALGETVVTRYDFDGAMGTGVSLNALLEPRLTADDGTTYLFSGYDFTFVPDPQQRPPYVTGTLYAVGTGGQQAFAFTLRADDERLSLSLRTVHLPMRHFTGKGLVAAEDGAYYDAEDRWLPLAVLPQRRYETEAVFEMDPALAFDGRQPGCIWHRLFLDACLPPDTEVAVECRAADSHKMLQGTPWETQPQPYLRATGAELPHYHPFSDDELQHAGTGTWELLFQRTRGRYMQLRLTLRGNGRRAPRLHALRAYYGRFSYLDAYLPAVYRRDEASASFLDRFLGNVEGTFTVIEGQIAEAQMLFDTRTVDDAYLDWLAGWLGAVLDPSYDAARRRLFIDHAIELYSQRGTPEGIARAVRLVTDPCPDETLFEPGAVACDVGRMTQCSSGTQVLRQQVRLIEHFLLRQAPGVVFGDPTSSEGPVLTPEGSAWSPRQGAGPLHAQYRGFLQTRYAAASDLSEAWEETHDSFGAVQLSPVPPAHEAKRADWQAFIRSELGFPYAEVDTSTTGRHPTDVALYRDFLQAKYGSINELNTAHQRLYAAFSFVELPLEDAFPESGARLTDWIKFTTLLLPMQRNAHRFTVLVPTKPGSLLAEQQALMDLVARVVEAEKPAHTYFEVKPYWALFRVGTARLGLDTLLDEGSRYVALLLGQGRLAEGYLAPSHPWDVVDRIIAGRDRVGSTPAL